MGNFTDIETQYKAKKATCGSKELARMEKALWEAAAADGVRKPGENRFRWFEARYGDTFCNYEHRSALLGKGPEADPLWERVDHTSMPLTTAIRLARQAEQLAVPQAKGLGFVLPQILENYDRLPARRAPNGKIIRREDPKSFKALVKSTREPTLYGNGKDTLTSKQHWHEIRRHISLIIAPKLHGTDPLFANDLQAEAEAELDAAIEVLSGRISRYANARRGIAMTGVPLDEIMGACDTLHIDRPEYGQLVDEKSATRMFRQLVKKFNTDRDSRPETVQNRKDVTDAFATIGRYNDFFRPQIVAAATE